MKSCLFDYVTIIPTNLIRDSKELLNDRNSVAILMRSCEKSRCKLDFVFVGDDTEKEDVFLGDDSENDSSNWKWTGKGEMFK